MQNEVDMCWKFVAPKLQAAGWDNEPHSIAEQRYFIDGIMVHGNVNKIIQKFGGANQLCNAVNQLQSLLYA